MISVKLDTKLMDRKLANAKKQIPFATSKALNDTADAVAERLTKAMDRYIDRPTPFTRRAFLTAAKRFKGKRATKRDLVAIIQADKAQNAYLSLQVFGGIRTPKKRAIMVPTNNAPQNQYGNLPRSVQKQIINGGKRYFKAGQRDGLSPGVYRRDRKGQITMIAAYEPHAKYRRIYPVHDIARDAVRYWWPIKAAKAARMALMTAR